MIKKSAVYYVTLGGDDIVLAEAWEALLKKEKISANRKLKQLIIAELERSV